MATRNYGSVKTVINGREYVSSGYFTLKTGAYRDNEGNFFENSNKENTSPNQPFTTISKPVPVEIDFTITDVSNNPLSQQLLKQVHNLSFIAGGINHLMTNATLNGRIEKSSENGELSGLTAVCTGANYKEVNL